MTLGATRKFTPSAIHAVTPIATHKVIISTTHKPILGTAHTVTPNAIHAVTQTGPKIVVSSGTHAVTAGRLRGVPASGAGRATILGQNYSVWRSGFRVRHGSGWRTFVALRTLAAIAIGSRHYYPYAYITAPRPYCMGLTEDGCQLMWQDVETIEGDIVSQCVAYCPWQ